MINEEAKSDEGNEIKISIGISFADIISILPVEYCSMRAYLYKYAQLKKIKGLRIMTVFSIFILIYTRIVSFLKKTLICKNINKNNINRLIYIISYSLI